MIIRQEQLKARYKNLFPLNETKENIDKLLKLKIDDPNKVLIISDKLNTKPIFFVLLIKYITKYDKLPSIDYLTCTNLNEIYFQAGTGDFVYKDLNSFKCDILALTYTKSDLTSKKSIELMNYLMDNYTTNKHKSVWAFVRKGCVEIEYTAKELNFTIIDLDNFVLEHTKTVISKPASRKDLF